MPVKVTENTTTSSSRTEEYVEKTHGEKVSDGMKEYWNSWDAMESYSIGGANRTSSRGLRALMQLSIPVSMERV